MTKVAKSALTKGRTLSFASDPTFRGYELHYPIRAIKDCHYEANATKIGDYPHVSLVIRATLTLEDSRDGVLFDKTIHLKDEADVMESEDDIGDGYIFPGSSIDLDLLCLSMIASSLPIRIVRPNSKLPKSGKGYNVYDEDTFATQEDEKVKTSPFDALKDLDV